MRVLFFNPSRAGQGNIPLNIPLLIAVLKSHHHQVRLFDFSDYACFDKLQRSYESIFFKEAQFNYGTISRDRKEFYKDDYGRRINGLDLKNSDYRADFEILLNDFRPDIIAVSSLSADSRFANDFILPFREKYKIPVIFGGIHTILLPDETLSSKACDFVCVGEGEKSLPSLLNAIENNKSPKGIKGIWFKENGKIVKNPPEFLADLTTLPNPDYEYFDPLHFYRPFDGTRYKMLNYELSRGCLFNCTYCVNGTLKEKYKGLGKYHRVKDTKQSIKELKSLIKKYNFNFIRFWDEDFTSISEKYLEEYAIHYEKINLPFLIYARVDTVTEKKVKILKKMGCRAFAMGIESGNELIRKRVMGRNISNNTIIEKFNLVKSYGIRASAYNMIGLPYETRNYIFETIELNRLVNPDSFSVTLLEPYKGTPIRKICENQGLSPHHETVYNQPQFIPKGMSQSELAGLVRTFPLYIRFPKDRYAEIKEAENNDSVYKRLLEEFSVLKKNFLRAII